MEIHIAIVVIFLALYFVSAKHSKKKLPAKSKILIPFYKIAEYITDIKIGRSFQRFVVSEKIIGHLKTLNPASKDREKIKLYYIEKITLVLLAIFLANLGGIFTRISHYTQVKNFDGISLIRNEYGEGDKEEELLVTAGETLIKSPFEVIVKDKTYTEDEVDQLFLKAMEELDKIILAGNESRDQVRSDLNLISKIPNMPIEVRWEVEDNTLMNQEGKLQEGKAKKEGTLINLKAILTYEEYRYEYSTYVNIYPKIQTEEEKVLSKLGEEIEKLQEETRSEELLKLPIKIGDFDLIWEKEFKNDGAYLLLVGGLAGVLLFFAKDQELSKKIEKRKMQMLLDYAELVSKLTLLLGAGMTVKGAWKKIVLDYKEKTEKNIIPVHFAYEEMLITYYEMEGGVPERVAYDRFGKRCKVQRYLKLSTLLTQNMKKGSRGLASMLEAEVIDAFEERKNQAKRMGEEAGTKLLIPMFMMLTIVIVIVVVPAFLSFGI